jgi:ABC-type Mn2+/Zn2+ transport system permease subunit
MSYPSTDEILASSKGWVASFLNFLPGLGSGYLYQRRWKPYFFTLTASTAWFALGIFLQGDSEPSQNEQIIGISGLFFISIVTVIEANLLSKKQVIKQKLKKRK